MCVHTAGLREVSRYLDLRPSEMWRHGAKLENHTTNTFRASVIQWKEPRPPPSPMPQPSVVACVCATTRGESREGWRYLHLFRSKYTSVRGPVASERRPLHTSSHALGESDADPTISTQRSALRCRRSEPIIVFLFLLWHGLGDLDCTIQCTRCIDWAFASDKFDIRCRGCVCGGA